MYISLQAVVDCFVGIIAFPDVSHRVVSGTAVKECVVVVAVFILWLYCIREVSCLLNQTVILTDFRFLVFPIISIDIQSGFQPFLDFGIDFQSPAVNAAV